MENLPSPSTQIWGLLRLVPHLWNCQDLLTVCRELNLEDSLEELMRELGADEHGRISYQEFLRRRLALRPEIDALRGRQGTGRRSTPEYLPTSSDNSLGAASAGKLESWEFDSGARDLSPEPHTLQKLVEAAGGSLTSGSTSNMLDLANKEVVKRRYSGFVRFRGSSGGVIFLGQLFGKGDGEGWVVLGLLSALVSQSVRDCAESRSELYPYPSCLNQIFTHLVDDKTAARCNSGLRNVFF
uniref:EF-hand domain-containing protein n=1 Tax=Timema shepardi TaxID=629360 RepID=A0A7R9G5X2_TIMSH|nr:unnamed protein product [Timema shepardi]